MKVLRIIGVVLLLAAAAFGTWAWYNGKAWLDRTVRERLHEVIDKATVAGYHFRMDSVETSAIAGDLLLSNVRLEIDSTLMDSLRNGDFRYLFAAHMDRLSLHGISYWRLLLRHEFRVERLDVEAPVLRYLVRGERVKLNEPFARLSNGGPSLVGLLRTDTLVVHDAACTVEDISGRLPLMRIAGLDMTVEGLQLRMQPVTHSVRVEVANAALALDSLHAELRSGYGVHIGAVRLERNGSTGSIDELVLTPPVDSATTAVTITALRVAHIGLRGVDLDRLIGDS
ncbi:MAG TPA: hypothetical protein VHL57_07530, partial [Flavobacteriales bacterium]|nr:hypothetical protein [Flavobacteriales bacterium]